MVTADDVMGAAVSHMAGRYAAGASDCAAAAFAVFEELWGVDLAPHVPRYDSMSEARAMLADAGGARSFVAQVAASAGLRSTAPEPGTIAAIPTTDGPLLMAVSVDGARWVAKGHDGLRIFEIRVPQAWGVSWR